MTKQNHKQNLKNALRDAYDNKIINHQEVIKTNNAIDWVKKQGYIVELPKEVLNAFGFFIMFLFVFALLLNPVQAYDKQLTYLNSSEKLLVSKTVTDYPIVDIKNNTDKISTFKLINNECGITSCISRINVDVYKDTIPIMQDFTVQDLKTLSYRQDIPIEVYIKTGEHIEFKPVLTSSDICNIKDYESNKKGCGVTYTYTNTAFVVEDFKKYDFTSLKSGAYIFEIRGKIKPYDYVDYIPTLSGVITPEFAVWSSSLEQGLKYYFQLNETSGIIAKNYDNNLSKRVNISGQPTNANWTSGKIGNGLTLNKSSFLTNTSLTNLFTTSGASFNFWIYQFNSPTAFQQHYEFNDGTNNIYTYFTNPTNLRIADYNGATEIAVNVNYTSYFNKWTMVTVNYNTSTVELYLDGAFIGSNTGSVNIPIAYGTAWVLGNDRTITRGINGTIDEIMLYNITLSPSKISDLYNGGAGLTYVNYSTIPTYPVFYNYTSNSPITNGTSSRVVLAVNINNTNGSVFLNFDGVNYTTSNISNRFNTSLSPSGAGTFTYYWIAYGNDSFKAVNISNSYNYTVNARTTYWYFSYDFTTTASVLLFCLIVFINLLLFAYGLSEIATLYAFTVAGMLMYNEYVLFGMLYLFASLGYYFTRENL